MSQAGAKRKAPEPIAEPKRKAVYRPLLDNPLVKVQWPEIPTNEGQLYLDLLCGLLRPLQPYIAEKSNHSHKSTAKAHDSQSQGKHHRPDVLAHLTLGINKSTQALESQTSEIYISSSYATKNHKTFNRAAKIKNPVTALFVARHDITPAILVSHFLMLSVTASPRVKVVTLPRKSMETISSFSGIAELGVVGVRKDCPNAEMLFQALEKVDYVSAPWGLPGENRNSGGYQGLNLKTIATTMPIIQKQQKNQKQNQSQSQGQGHIATTMPIIQKQKNQKNQNQGQGQSQGQTLKQVQNKKEIS
ncbi:hypothetical protein BZA70DRAFT_311659 [Myxozyma melibiosi]|uniref:Uncharacterized protein n=1 Tax=Myxozyma melibiosi TaxID=54550 RepID=A0ABR1F2A1_9ASCO